MERYAIILAGGEGHRAGGDLPKQFQMLSGQMMIWWSLDAFRRSTPDVHLIIVIHPGYFDEWDKAVDAWYEHDLSSIRLVCGGRTRWESVKNGLMEVPESEDALVAIHDSARPLVSTDLIKRGWLAAEKHNAAIPVVPLTDSIRFVEDDSSIAVDRSMYRAVQTPQVFRASLIKSAYTQSGNSDGFTDDASVAENAGHKIYLFEGETQNIKVTNPCDFAIAEILLNQK